MIKLNNYRWLRKWMVIESLVDMVKIKWCHFIKVAKYIQALLLYQ